MKRHQQKTKVDPKTLAAHLSAWLDTHVDSHTIYKPTIYELLEQYGITYHETDNELGAFIKLGKWRKTSAMLENDPQYGRTVDGYAIAIALCNLLEIDSAGHLMGRGSRFRRCIENLAQGKKSN